MAPFPTPARAPAPAARPWLPTLALVALGSVATFALACEDDPDEPFYLGAAGGLGSTAGGSPYGNPYVPDAGGAAGAGAGGAPSVSAASRCVTPLETATPALLAVGSLSLGDGVLRASFDGAGYELAPDGACPAAAAAGAAGAAGGPAGAGDLGASVNLPSPVYAWAALADGKRVAVTDRQLVLLTASGTALAACDLPAVAGETGTSLGRRRAAFDPADPLHAWITDGGAELYERRLVDEAPNGVRCDTSGPAALTFDRPTLVRDVAARAEAGRLWLAVVAQNDDRTVAPQVLGARVEAGKLVIDSPPPAAPGPCNAGGLSAADAVATLPGGGVAVADGACGAVVVFGPALDRPLARFTLPAGDAPRALAADAKGSLFIASAVELHPGSQVGLWRAELPAAPASP
ncbi:MAG TPA: hypothetical protein VFS00_32420 [Polyangiaceae bacterium]|nr:hypothetical protein [Polyangiaceae bacterium]